MSESSLLLSYHDYHLASVYSSFSPESLQRFRFLTLRNLVKDLTTYSTDLTQAKNPNHRWGEMVTYLPVKRSPLFLVVSVIPKKEQIDVERNSGPL
ncbi:uncharacterized protein LACBIDRAFT_299528 [Laccaria bicolor S238N-H82]|uniref:Predicted protein n=1 Tax=Laccaria bicolor (strain S238N-H82 / ATCC MYA-4686) TaxID=486041 RepID=B0DZ06_LACBS|nr:uncharacterized protein LACBIDRAFT_314678 [Laccaria bicolor S238N-H82]XP_001890829.1 uncharacterized protein LACBIDRAFT_299528 [Laccaria bicolor S238N-H82]EDQ98524.1 predicted protein [Laccaria bicolor S238N-H82]EDR00148.1 predicted protein [Laccaria bicolor S238N-H82]|eukprot:XP_001889205.1 predicted protein [Laccaria bicolor S238N-H82]